MIRAFSLFFFASYYLSAKKALVRGFVEYKKDYRSKIYSIVSRSSSLAYQAFLPFDSNIFTFLRIAEMNIVSFPVSNLLNHIKFFSVILFSQILAQIKIIKLKHRTSFLEIESNSCWSLF